jgi:hypothetical protein
MAPIKHRLSLLNIMMANQYDFSASNRRSQKSPQQRIRLCP